MAIQPMFPAVNNSIPTQTTALISASAAVIPIANPAVLPAGPNIATLGTEDNAELVQYAAIEENTLTGCIRGFGGTTAQIWPQGTILFRAYTAVDHDRFVQNIEDLQAKKLDDNGNLLNAKVTFTPAMMRGNITSGERLALTMGKLARWYSDLGAAAWMQVGTTAATVSRGNHTHSGYAPLDAAGKVAAAAQSARSVQVTSSRSLTLDDCGRCLDVTGSEAVTITIPADSAAAIPIDTEIEIAQEGTGAVWIQPGTGVGLYSVLGRHGDGVQLLSQYAVCVLKKKGANSWRVTGELLWVAARGARASPARRMRRQRGGRRTPCSTALAAVEGEAAWRPRRAPRVARARRAWCMFCCKMEHKWSFGPFLWRVVAAFGV